MRIDKQKIIIIIIAVIFIIAGVIIYMQQRTINKLSGLATPPLLGGNVDQGSGTAPTLPQNLVDMKKNDLLASKEITGMVTSISGNIISVEADMIDLDKIAQAESIDKLAQTKKTFKVTMNEKTEFVARKLAAINLWQTIKVTAAEPVYKNDALTAVQVIDPAVAEQKIDNPLPTLQDISGHVISKGDNAITVKATGKNNGKTFTVKIADNTKMSSADFRGVETKSPPKLSVIGLSDIRVNDNITVFTTSDIKSTTDVEASSIIVTIS